MDLGRYNQRILFGADMELKDLLDSNDICWTIQKEIVPLVKDTDFNEMYKSGGRPPVSPRVLLLTTIMQFLERLPDREATLNLKYRLDWKIVFGLEMNFKGIHHTTLVYFRDRLLKNQKVSYAFDKILDHLTELGLVKKNQKQRIDSTHIIGKVRELSRLELLHETLRLFCEDIAPYEESLDNKLKEYYKLYVEKISIRGIADVQKEMYIKNAGLAMRGFIEWSKLPSTDRVVVKLESYKTLVTVFEQNFEDKDPGSDNPPKLIKIATGKDHICSPHETEARFSSKGKKKWIGYKAQVVETINSGKQVNFITHIEVQDSTDHDATATIPAIEELEKKEISPSELYGDTHYNSSDNIKDSSAMGVDLKGPVAPVTKERDKRHEGFKVFPDQEIATCPKGIESKKFTTYFDGTILATFPQKNCETCDLKEVCKPEPRGKRFEARLENEILTKRREMMKTEEFKIDMHNRNGIEGTISGLVRGQAMRISRYRGKKKTSLQIYFCGAAANITRLHRQRRNERKMFEKVENEAQKAA